MLAVVITIMIGIIIINELQKSQNNYNINIGGNILLTDHNGKTFNSGLIKKKKLVYFGYTFCPDVCPFDMLKLSKFIDHNPEFLKKMEFIFITVDPTRDNKLQIKSFLENFNPSILGLTGTDEQINRTIQNFKIFVRKNNDFSTNENYLIDHSSLFFLLDKDDKYITHFQPDDLKTKMKDYF